MLNEAEETFSWLGNLVKHKDSFTFSLHRVQTDSGAHPASNSMDTGGYFPGSRAARA